MPQQHNILRSVDGLCRKVGAVTVWDNGKVTFSEETPPEVRAEIRGGIGLAAPFAGEGLLARIGWLLAPPMISVKPGDPRFLEALEKYNSAQFKLDELSHQPASGIFP